MTTAMATLPPTLGRTLTWEQGQEMTNDVQIAAATELHIYFCHPHLPWRRGSNENTNGPLRRYFPKFIDLSIHRPDHREDVADELNQRSANDLAGERQEKRSTNCYRYRQKINQVLRSSIEPTRPVRRGSAHRP